MKHNHISTQIQRRFNVFDGLVILIRTVFDKDTVKYKYRTFIKSNIYQYIKYIFKQNTLIHNYLELHVYELIIIHIYI